MHCFPFLRFIRTKHEIQLHDEEEVNGAQGPVSGPRTELVISLWLCGMCH